MISIAQAGPPGLHCLTSFEGGRIWVCMSLSWWNGILLCVLLGHDINRPSRPSWSAMPDLLMRKDAPGYGDEQEGQRQGSRGRRRQQKAGKAGGVPAGQKASGSGRKANSDKEEDGDDDDDAGYGAGGLSWEAVLQCMQVRGGGSVCRCWGGIRREAMHADTLYYSICVDWDAMLLVASTASHPAYLHPASNDGFVSFVVLAVLDKTRP
eukprot:1161217-Pelagomonas_calceolata.AAC.4